jgi:hypothetical protein
MAFFIYDHLQTSKMIEEDPADYEICRWNQNPGVKIPKGDKQDTQNKVFIGHCMFPSYKRTVYKGTDPLNKDWVADICELGICINKDKSHKDKSDLETMQQSIISMAKKFVDAQKYSPTRKFMRNSTVA